MKTVIINFFSPLILVFFLFAPLYAQEGGPVSKYTLDDCVEIAMERSSDILTAKEGIKLAKGVVFEKWSSILSVNAEAKYTYTGLIPETTSASGLSSGLSTPLDEPDDQYDFGITASLTLFSGGKVIWGLNIAHLQLQVAEEQYRIAVNEAVYDTKVAFYAILLAKKKIEMRLEELDLLTRNLEKTEDKYRNGLVPKYDVMRIEVEAINARTSLIEAKNDLTVAYEDLKKLLDIDLGKPIEIEGELKYYEREADLKLLLTAAETESPERNIAGLNERIADRNVDIAIGDFFPAVKAFANYDHSATGWEKISFNEPDWEFTAGVVVEIPITDLVLSMAKKKQANAEYKVAELKLKDTKRDMEYSIRSAYYDLVESKEIIKLQEYNIGLSEENLKTAELRYENGVGTLLELLDARLAVTEAKLNYLTALFNHEKSLSQIRKLLGREGTTN
ncbi:MAG: TolC family protein [Deltaproteobacteria bacterium]|uniref:TolC family protein n=1 Tax=Candidatus Zymogenus saltonus TaxID=2844893 RepID=A0A9D8KB88_9DELT|nr:TolC family protein [Candidatus Zymogenus saltonus]